MIHGINITLYCTESTLGLIFVSKHIADGRLFHSDSLLNRKLHYINVKNAFLLCE